MRDNQTWRGSVSCAWENYWNSAPSNSASSSASAKFSKFHFQRDVWIWKIQTIPALNSCLQKKKNGNFHIKSHVESSRKKIRKPSWRHFSCRFVFNLSILINLRNKFNSFVSNISAKKLSAVTTSIDHSKPVEMSPI